MISQRELVQLYILQKDYHANKEAGENHVFVQQYKALLQELDVEIAECVAPAIFAGQPDIPYVLFKPMMADGEQRPLIMHTHGGPHVRFYMHTPHAEILYFLSRGYIVACPNYRGSSDHPKADKHYPQFAMHEDSEVGLGEYAPEDVFAVACELSAKSWVDADRLTLRGGSFGSYVNACLLKGIHDGKFKNLFRCVHLSGATGYPKADCFPKDIPLFISHGERDEIAPYYHYEQLTKSLLVKQMPALTTFSASYGNHHLIEPTLSLQDVGSPAYQELVQFLKLSTEFVDYHNNRQQFLTIAAQRAQIAKTMLHRVSFLSTFKSRSRAAQLLEQPPVFHDPGVVSLTELNMEVQVRDYVPFSPRENIQRILRDRFNEHEAEHDFLTNEYLRLIENERALMGKKICLYHACNDEIGFIYDVYTAIYQLLHIDHDWQALRPDHELAHMLKCISDFTKYFNSDDQCSEINNKPHYNEIAISANLFLFAHLYELRSCSVNYQLKNRTERKIDLQQMLRSLFDAYQVPAYLIEELYGLFEEEGKSSIGVLYQLTFSPETVNKYAHSSITMGRSAAYFGKTDLVDIVNEIVTSDRKTKEWDQCVRKIQVRMMLPITLNQTNRVVRRLNNPEQYRSRLQALAQCLVKSMLFHDHVHLPYNHQTALVRIYNQVTAAQTLYMKAQKPEVVLVRALVQRQAHTVIKLIKAFPHLKTMTFALPRQYIRMKDEKDDETVTTTSLLKYMVADQQLSFSIITECYPPAEAHAVIAAELRGKKLSEQVLVLARVPEDLRLRFYDCFSLSQVSNHEGYELCKLVGLLPESDREKFILDHAALWRWYLPGVLKHLTPARRYPVVVLLKDLPNISDRLATILADLPAEDRQPCFDLLGCGIKGAYEYCTSVKLLPTPPRMLYKKFLHLITDHSSLQRVADVVAADDADVFAEDMVKTLKGSYELATILCKLAAPKRLAYTRKALPYMRDTKLCSVVYEQLPTADCLTLFTERWRDTSSMYDFERIIKLLPVDSRYQFAKNLQGIITHGFEIMYVIKYLQSHEMKDYITNNIKKIDHQNTVGDILRLDKLDDEFKLNLVRQKRHLLLNWSAIQTTFQYAPHLLSRYLAEFTAANYHASFQWNYYTGLMKLIPSHYLLAFVKVTNCQVQSLSDMADILGEREIAVIVAFIKSQEHLIHEFNDYVTLIRHIKKLDIIQFMNAFSAAFDTPLRRIQGIKEYEYNENIRLALLKQEIGHYLPLQKEVIMEIVRMQYTQRPFCFLLLEHMTFEWQFTLMISLIKNQHLRQDLQQAWQARSYPSLTNGDDSSVAAPVKLH